MSEFVWTEDRINKMVARLENLTGAVRELYFSAYWHADRPVDEAALWTAVRDAAGIQPGQTRALLGEDRSS